MKESTKRKLKLPETILVYWLYFTIIIYVFLSIIWPTQSTIWLIGLSIIGLSPFVYYVSKLGVDKRKKIDTEDCNKSEAK